MDYSEISNSSNSSNYTLPDVTNSSAHTYILSGNVTNDEMKLNNTEYFVVNILFEKILKILITVFGILGNGLIIVLLTKQKNRRSSTSVYLTALAISDILVLIFGPLSHWFITMWDINISKYGSFECKIYAFMQSTSVSISSWLLVAVTIERVICVRYPCHVRRHCTQRLAIIYIIVIWLIMYVADIHFLWGMGHKYSNTCEPLNDKYQSFMNYVLPWIDFWTAFGLPVLLLSVGNILIICQVTITRKKRNRMTFSRGIDSSSITPILISATVVFMLTMAPYYCVSVCLPHWISKADPKFVFYMTQFWQPILKVLWESNASLNFVLYFLSGSKFRFEVKAMLSCSCQKYSHRGGVFDQIYIADLPLRHFTVDTGF